MACFLTPMVVAVFTSIFRKKIPNILMINILNLLLWGGVVGLAIEHFARGEVVPYPPFLTAGLEHVILEMVTIGIPMTMSVSGVWGLIVLTVNGPLNRLLKPSKLGLASISQTRR
ncbi:MAG: hypothetical protein FGF52_06305 [Candidatus Brockarchaeota archaeon]|nr:hypothetical protein [Candidatus Brockarchaeota archaeon]